MSRHRNSSFLFLSVLNIYFLACSCRVNSTVSDSSDKLEEMSSLSADPAVKSPVFKPAVSSIFTLNLLSSFPEDLEISDYCSDLLHIFGQRYVTYVNCLVPAARPVKVCQACFSSYGSLVETYNNISSDQMGPGNVSCRDSLLRSDRLMVVYVLYSNLQDLWGKSDCDMCITKGFQSLTNDMLYFMTTLNQTITCFDKYKQGNHSELCKNCKQQYRELNVLYSSMEKNHTLCIDIEDAAFSNILWPSSADGFAQCAACTSSYTNKEGYKMRLKANKQMNMTRKLWSKTFNCSFPREETVPVIAVSSFMLFLPIIFYLSSFLHSEQKKRKLIHPNRAKSYTSLMNIQDKQS